MSYTIDYLTKDRVSEYRQLRLKSYLEDPFAFSESYEDEKQKPLSAFENELIITGTPPEQFMLGAFDQDNILIGFVKYRRDLRTKARHKSMVHAMYVDLSHRNQGVGKLLIDRVLELAKGQQGLEQIHLWVLHSSHSKTALKFYARCGFISQGPLVKKDLKIGSDYIDAEYMVFYIP